MSVRRIKSKKSPTEIKTFSSLVELDKTIVGGRKVRKCHSLGMVSWHGGMWSRPFADGRDLRASIDALTLLTSIEFPSFSIDPTGEWVKKVTFEHLVFASSPDIHHLIGKGGLGTPFIERETIHPVLGFPLWTSEYFTRHGSLLGVLPISTQGGKTFLSLDTRSFGTSIVSPMIKDPWAITKTFAEVLTKEGSALDTIFSTHGKTGELTAYTLARKARSLGLPIVPDLEIVIPDHPMSHFLTSTSFSRESGKSRCLEVALHTLGWVYDPVLKLPYLTKVVYVPLESRTRDLTALDAIARIKARRSPESLVGKDIEDYHRYLHSSFKRTVKGVEAAHWYSVFKPSELRESRESSAHVCKARKAERPIAVRTWVEITEETYRKLISGVLSPSERETIMFDAVAEITKALELVYTIDDPSMALDEFTKDKVLYGVFWWMIPPGTVGEEAQGHLTSVAREISEAAGLSSDYSIIQKLKVLASDHPFKSSIETKLPSIIGKIFLRIDLYLDPISVIDSLYLASDIKERFLTAGGKHAFRRRRDLRDIIHATLPAGIKADTTEAGYLGELPYLFRGLLRRWHGRVYGGFKALPSWDLGSRSSDEIGYIDDEVELMSD